MVCEKTVNVTLSNEYTLKPPNQRQCK